MKKRQYKRKYFLAILLSIVVFIFIIAPIINFLIPKSNQVFLSPMLLTGKSEVVITDKKDNTSFIDFYIHSNNIKYQIIGSGPTIPSDLVSGEDIEVSGG